ncbi:MAG TPA: threonylcarbamoyl-AMP synthase [Anaerolineaceae bacterium]|nr:MAG: Sua5/YciO/YrdC/YwlC family protein [Anaerolineae bacterium 49_20]HAE85246.1 threonylcarbamoyl-AMP synthase [Anaerolineaceae bacterium]
MNAINTLILPITDPQALPLSQAYIQAGKLIVFPTDTLYGLACDPANPAALRSVYAAKCRSTLKALPVLIGAFTQLDQVVQRVPPQARRLMERFWPGALTLVLPKQAHLPSELTPYPGLAVRMPDHPFTLQLLQALGPLAVTSANLSDQANPQTAQEVFAQLASRVDLILDGGKLKIGQASTVIDCTGAEPALLRAGPIPFETLMQVWQEE